MFLLYKWKIEQTEEGKEEDQNVCSVLSDLGALPTAAKKSALR